MGFAKASGKQAALKIGMYGPPGSGKTATALLIAEGLAKHYKKRVAFVDTERGTDFYTQPVKNRRFHPESFDFDAIYTRSISEILKEVRALDPNQYGVLVLDSITHIWEACILAYQGRKTRAGTIPMHAWAVIKKPYRDLMQFVLSSPLHVIICGRQGHEYAEDELSGELKTIGVKMKAEGETAYEPHILIRMESVKEKGHKEPVIKAFAEKDRTGILAGMTIPFPTYENVALPLLGLLGETQARMQTDDEISAKDAALMDEPGQNGHQPKPPNPKTLEAIEAATDLTPLAKAKTKALELPEAERKPYIDAIQKQAAWVVLQRAADPKTVNDAESFIEDKFWCFDKTQKRNIAQQVKTTRDAMQSALPT